MMSSEIVTGAGFTVKAMVEIWEKRDQLKSAGKIQQLKPRTTWRETVSGAGSTVKDKISKLFGWERPVHQVAVGGKPDVFMWKKLSAVVLGAAIIWVLFEVRIPQALGRNLSPFPDTTKISTPKAQKWGQFFIAEAQFLLHVTFFLLLISGAHKLLWTTSEVSTLQKITNWLPEKVKAFLLPQRTPTLWEKVKFW